MPSDHQRRDPEARPVTAGEVVALLERAEAVLPHIEPGVLHRSDAKVARDALTRLANMVGAAQAALVRRVAETTPTQRGDVDGSKRAAQELGTTRRDAARMMELDRQLQDAPATKDAFAAGASVGEVRQHAEKLRCQGEDGEARLRRLHSQRRLSTWSKDGMGFGRWQVPLDRQVEVLKVLDPYIEAIFDTARREGRHEHPEAYAADALLALARNAHRPPRPSGTSRQGSATDRQGRVTGGPSETSDRPATTSRPDGGKDLTEATERPTTASRPGTGGPTTCSTCTPPRTTGTTDPGAAGDPRHDQAEPGLPVGHDTPRSPALADLAGRDDGPATAVGDELVHAPTAPGADGLTLSRPAPPPPHKLALSPPGTQGGGSPSHPPEPPPPSSPGRGGRAPEAERPPADDDAPCEHCGRADPPPEPAAAGSTRSGVRPKAIIRIDHSALVRGHTEPGETCDILGVGPISVAAARAMLTDDDPIITAVLTDGDDVTRVVHLGRKATATIRTALEWMNVGCCVSGCPNTRRLEIDHTIDWSLTKHTKLAELDWLCAHHHKLKTHDGYTLQPGRGKRQLLPPDQPALPLPAP